MRILSILAPNGEEGLNVAKAGSPRVKEDIADSHVL